MQRLRAFLDKKFNLKGSKNIQVYNIGIPGEVTGRLTKRIVNELVDRVKLADTKNNIVVISVSRISLGSGRVWLLKLGLLLRLGWVFELRLVLRKIRVSGKQRFFRRLLL